MRAIVTVIGKDRVVMRNKRADAHHIRLQFLQKAQVFYQMLRLLAG